MIAAGTASVALPYAASRSFRKTNTLDLDECYWVPTMSPVGAPQIHMALGITFAESPTTSPVQQISPRL
jgi:hypothetical protein